MGEQPSTAPTSSGLELVPANDPILREKLPRFDFSKTEVNPVELYNQLGQKLIDTGGIGLAANQVGWRHRFFVLNTNPIQGFFNPIIVDQGEELIKLEEGCLTMPKLYLKINRPQIIKVRYFDPLGKATTTKFEGITARCIQHEIDHLDGILFTTKVTKLELMLAIKKSKKNYIIGDIS